MLNELPVPEKPFDRPSTVEENLALVDSRYQYLEELKREKLKAEENNTRAHINPFRLDLSLNGGFGGHLANGLLLTCTDEKGSGILLESLMELLTKMTEHNFSTNLKVLPFFCKYSLGSTC
jgi:hypothetical protein